MARKLALQRTGMLLVALSLLAAGCRGAETGAAGGDAGGDAGGSTEAASTGVDPAEGTEAESATEAEGSDAATSEEEGSGDASEEASGGASEESSAAGEVAFDAGVTEEPCPDAVNPDNGCIYLGTLSDLTQGPFAALGGSITEAQAAFWRTVNEEGGIGGFDVDVTTYVRDNLYNPETHNQLYQEIKPNILALAQSLGSPTTAAILDDLNAESIVTAPASWTSAWDFQDVIVESGANYCIESMNGIDYAVENFEGPIETVMAVHYPGDYGDDGAAGARIAAEANGLEFIDVPTNPGADNQAGAIAALVGQSPDLVVMTTNPTDMATVAGQAAAQGFTGRILGNGPTWNPGVLQTPAIEFLATNYTLIAPWGTYTSDTPGHEAMRAALGTEEGNDGFTSGWAWSYPLRAALEQAAENGDLTREGVLAAVGELESVDFQGMLPEEAGNYTTEGQGTEGVLRANIMEQIDRESSTGVGAIDGEFYTGPTAEAYEFEGPCYQTGG